MTQVKLALLSLQNKQVNFPWLQMKFRFELIKLTKQLKITTNLLPFYNSMY